MGRSDGLRKWWHEKLYERITVDEVLSDKIKVHNIGGLHYSIGAYQAVARVVPDRYKINRKVRIMDNKGTIGEIRFVGGYVDPEKFLIQGHMVKQKLGEIDVSPGTTFEVSNWSGKLRGVKSIIKTPFLLDDGAHYRELEEDGDISDVERFRLKLRRKYGKLSPNEIKEDLKKDKRFTLATGILIGLANALGLGYTIYSSNPMVALLTYVGPFSLGIPTVFYKTLQYLERSDIAEECLKKKGGDIPE